MVGTIFLQCEKIFWDFPSQFPPVLLKSLDLVQKTQTNSIFISTFNFLCYDIEPRVNKENSFNLLENMLTLFTTVQSFSYAKEIKEKHSRIHPKQRCGLLNASSKPVAVSGKWL